ncbi:hypothetical protein ACFL6T_02540 [Candidatus Zixiibacteriota bacterium]
MRPAPALYVLLIPLLMLAGCLEVKQEIWIEPDGSGKIRFDISAPSPGEGSTEASSVPAEEVIAIARELRRDPRLKSTPRVGQFVLDGMDHVDLELLLYNWSDLSAINHLMLEMAGSDSEVSAVLSRLFEFSLVEDEEGNILYRQILSREDLQASREYLSNNQSFTDVSLAGGLLSIVVHSPTISRSNGSWQLDKTSVRWRMALRELARGRGTIQAFEAEIGASARSPHFWRVIGIILIVSMLVGILTWFRHARRRARRSHDKIR